MRQGPRIWLLTSVVTLALGTASLSGYADQPVKAPPSERPPPVLNWTGFYAGINLGYGVGRNEITDKFCGLFDSDPLFGGTGCVAEKFKTSPSGIIAGGQAGYNWQWLPHWLIGVEADFQGSGQKGRACTLDCVFDLLGSGVTIATTTEQKINWFSTLRGRVGYAENGWLLYVTAGGAFAEIQSNITTNVSFPGVPSSASFDSRERKSGYVVGTGVETQLAGGPWTAKLEYLYMNFGSVTSPVRTVLDGDPAAPASGPVTIDIHNHIIRAGLNYRFAWADPAYAADHGPVYRTSLRAANWNGLYAGVNVGYSVGTNPFIQTLIDPPAVFPEQAVISPAGLIGGAKLGFNWQHGYLVAGVEGDFQLSGQKDAVCMLECTTGSPTIHIVTTQRLDWFSTLRGRIGYAQNDWLWYVTGGGVAAHVTTKFDGRFRSDVSVGANFSDSNRGWVAGSGIEMRLAGNWSMNFEYLYLDLGPVSSSFTFPQCGGLSGLCTVQTTIDIHDHIIRAGLNYRFGP